jgi:NAD(P)-dependent dehydrogenase (short-subunit alcohol dehydrogenase family)
MKILIVGGSGGIGSAMVKEVMARFADAEVHATFNTRSNPPDSEHIPGVSWHRLDVTDEAEIKALSESFESLDWLINCAGMLHTDSRGPEKSLSQFDADFFLHNIKVNAMPSLLLAKHFSAKLKSSAAPRLAVLSAKVGSISDNRLGGWYSYRASKAALNMLIKTLAVEWQRSLKQGVVLALHPGTTQTRLSAPFQANVPEGKLFSPERVAADLIAIIANAKVNDSGSFFAYDCTVLGW